MPLQTVGRKGLSPRGGGGSWVGGLCGVSNNGHLQHDAVPLSSLGNCTRTAQVAA